MTDTPRTSELSLGRETIVAFASRMTTALVGFAGIVVFANVLGDEGLGEYRTIMAAGFVLSRIFAGLGAALQKRVSESETATPPYFGATVSLYVAASLAMGIGFAVAWPWAVEYFGSPELAFATAMFTLALGLFDIGISLYSGIGYPGRSSWLDTVRSVLTLPLQLLFLYFGFRVLGVTVGLIVATVLSAALTLVIAGVVPTRPTRDTFSRLGSFAKWSIPTGVVSNAYANVDVLILRSVAGSGPVGFYAAANQLGMPAAMFANSVRQPLTVKASGLSSLGKEIHSDLRNAFAYTGLIAVPVFFGAVSMPSELMGTVFGAEFFSAGPALVGLTAYRVIEAYKMPFEAAFEGTNRPHIIFKMNTAILVVHIPLAFVLGRSYGLLGVVAATVLTEAARLSGYQYLAYAEMGAVVFARPIAEQFAAAVVMFGGIELLRAFVSITGWPTLVVVVGFGATVYFGVLTAISTHFRETVLGAVESARTG